MTVIYEFYYYLFREPYVIFSGGMPYDKASRTPSLTVMHAKNTTVLEMEHNVVDFLTLCHTPWNSGQYIQFIFVLNYCVVKILTVCNASLSLQTWLKHVL